MKTDDKATAAGAVGSPLDGRVRPDCETYDWSEEGMMSVPYGRFVFRSDFDAAVAAERERINTLLAAIRAHWVKANGEDSMSVSALDVIAGVIADGSYVERA